MQLKINKFLTASLLTCMLMGGFLFNACKSTEPDTTSSITLNAFGPSAALRGGELKFIGTNLDKVTAVDLIGTAEITTFVSKSSTELVIAIPQDTKPGLIVLKTPQGDITTKTPLTFTEPILITTYVPAAVKAGDVFTISGDYLNLIAKVIFSDGAVVDSAKFITKSRQQITLYVPKAAKTGKVAISNGATIPVLVYTPEIVTVTDPTTVTSIAPIPVKPLDSLKITGTFMNLIKSVILPDGNKIDSAAIAINAAKTQITVLVPKVAKEGQIKVVTYSGTIIPVTTLLKLIGPSITSVSPMLLKNGDVLSITGTNLDLVTTSTFTGAVAGTISNQSATSLQLTVPMTAIDGTVVLGTNSGLTATSAAITLVKPTFTSITPLTLTAGETVSIVGTDLDLVRKVIFVGGLTVNVTPGLGGTSLIVVVPLTASGNGTVKFETVNGTQVTSTDQLVIIAATTPAIANITTQVSSGGLMTITGKNLNNVESIYFQDNVKAVLYGVRSENSIQVYVPETAKHGVITFTLNSFDGKKVVSPTFIYGTDPVVDPSLMIYSFDAGWSGFTWDGVGGLGTLPDGLAGTNEYYEVYNYSASKYWLFANNYISYPSVTVADHVLKMEVRLRTDVTGNGEIRIMLNGVEVNILPYLKVGDHWSTNSQWKTITIPLSAFTGLPTPTPVKGGNWGMTMYGGTSDFTGFCVDNIRYEKITGPTGVYGLY